MKFIDRLKDLFLNFPAKLLLFIFFIGGTGAMFSIIRPRESSPINLLASIPFQDISLILMSEAFLSSMFLLLIHELLKLIGFEIKGDIRFSTIATICFFLIITIRNLLIVLTIEQIDLVLMLFGLPFLVFLPRIFRLIVEFNPKQITPNQSDEKAD
ncbi:TPA: hypothetical protein U1C85_001986 [Streptococcus suis]|nr:hypothetical protein [Streptococcus suis]